MFWLRIIVAVIMVLGVVWYGLEKSLHKLLQCTVFQPTVTTCLKKALHAQDYLHQCKILNKARDTIDIVTIPLGKTFEKNSTPLLLYCYGNGGCLADRIEDLHQLSKALQMDIVAYDPRGYGASTTLDKLSADTWIQDGKQVYAWLRYHYPQRPIVVWGVSLGGAVTASLASEAGVRAVVMMTTFARLSDVIAFIFFKKQSTPLQVLVDCILPASYHFPSAQALTLAKKPSLIIHATDDELMSTMTAQRLKLASPSTTTYLEIKGHHNNNALYAQINFIKEWLKLHC